MFYLQDLFNFQQANLEGITERLGKLLFSGNVVDKSDELRNLVSVAKAYLKNLVSGFEDQMEDLEDE